MGIPIALSVAGAIVVGVGGFLLGRRRPSSVALPWSLMAVGLVATVGTTVFAGRDGSSAEPAASASQTASEDPIASGESGTASPLPAETEQALPDERVTATAASTGQPETWPTLPPCVDDYLVHETPSAREPHFVAENKSLVFTHAPGLRSILLVGDGRIIGALRVSASAGSGAAFDAHDLVDASCDPVEFTQDEVDGPPGTTTTGTPVVVAFTLEGQPYELEVRKEDFVQAAATLRAAQ